MIDHASPLAVSSARPDATATTSRRTRGGHPSWLRQDLALLLPLAIFLGAALVLPFVYHGSPTTQDLRARLEPPVFLAGGSWAHPLGTDSLGRDVLARTLSAMSLSLRIGMMAAAGAAVIGIALGLVAATGNRVADAIVTMLADVVLTVPFVVVGIVVTAILGQGLPNVIAVLVLTGWVSYARIVRLQTRSIANSDFITAARSLGGDRLHIAIAHILPNLAPVLVLLVCQQVGAMMLYEASLTYLGIGLPIERLSLGGLVQSGQDQIFKAWWIGFMPGLALALAVIGLNLAAEWLQRRMRVREG
ncbi:MAG: ABC transporter permease [Thermomicrobiales bacterium]